MSQSQQLSAFGERLTVNATANSITLNGSFKLSGSPFYENPTTVTADYSITANNNAFSAGPITVNSGVTVTVPSGSVWTIS